MSTIIGHFINGDFITPDNIEHSVFNPATDKEIAKVLFADKKICDKAVLGAKKAFNDWARTPLTKRSKIFFEFRNLLVKHQEELANIITKEHGKTLDDAKGEIMRAIEVVELHTGLLTKLQGDFTSNVATDIDCYTFYEPLGIACGISPFNFPVMVPVWMLAPAIACGNCFILKPSEQDPSAPMFLMKLLNDAGLPPGVCSVINGDKNTVDYLLDNQSISAFTAVASTPVAKYIYTRATGNGKRAHTFGGAKNHAVIMPDCDMQNTAKALTGAGFGSAGERCMAISVAVCVGDNTADELIKHLIPLIHNIKIDIGTKENVDMGPLISNTHKDKVISFIDAGIKEHATLLIDGREFQHPTLDGYFLGASLFDNVHEKMTIYQNEIFGPVLLMLRVNTLDEAIALINRNQYANGTAIFTQNGFSAHKYTNEIDVGMIGINIPIPVPIASHPFGGFKDSSFGDTAMHGRESINFYTKRKTVTSRWFSQNMNENAFSMPTHD